MLCSTRQSRDIGVEGINGWRECAKAVRTERPLQMVRAENACRYSWRIKDRAKMLRRPGLNARDTDTKTIGRQTGICQKRTDDGFDIIRQAYAAIEDDLNVRTRTGDDP
jgi:hypothetical protein